MRYLIPLAFLIWTIIFIDYTAAEIGKTSVGPVDPKIGNIVTISAEHNEIHEGEHFTTCDDDQDVDAAKYWRITTPNTSNRIHLAGFFISSINGTLEFFQNPTLSGQGTTLNSFNNDANSSNTTTAVFAKDPTTSNDGIRAFVSVIGSDGNNPVGASGGFQNRNNEFILKQNEDYVLKYTPEGTDNRVSICFEFYEED